MVSGQCISKNKSKLFVGCVQVTIQQTIELLFDMRFGTIPALLGMHGGYVMVRVSKESWSRLTEILKFRHDFVDLLQAKDEARCLSPFIKEIWLVGILATEKRYEDIPVLGTRQAEE
ncbi:hypothetical protein IFM89_024885 [Coptis chinensis]|uniref:Uncharacterized protein n=1 Tax=Coptis chinensis TaxID=261450 RepID=A0A835H8N4_9MAGN|nr:hypothetical protein IFM89_024885 [Coptis chinensis]